MRKINYILKISFIVLLLANLATISSAVTKDVPGDYNSIQTAIDNAIVDNIDIIKLQSGRTYLENLSVQSITITIQSDDPENTHIIGQNEDEPVIDIFSAELTLDGVTIENEHGGGLYFLGSKASIKNCSIQNCQGDGIYFEGNTKPSIIDCTIQDCIGTGISSSSAFPTIKNCLISGCQGHGILYGNLDMLDEDGTITNCTITNCNKNGIYCNSHSDPIITNCAITYCNKSGIFCNDYSDPTIKNCILKENYSTTYNDSPNDLWGGGICCVNSSPSIENCIIEENEAIVGGGIFSFCYDNPPIIINNCILKGNKAIKKNRWI